MKRILGSVMALCMLVPAAGWGKDFSIKKPQINGVSSVAIISLYTNASVRKADNRAGSVSAVGSLLKKAKQGDAPAHFGGTELIGQALEAYAAALGAVPGWTVLDPKAMLADPAYQSFISSYTAGVGSKGMEMMAKSRTTVDGMAPIVRVDKNGIANIKALCAALNVSAVAIIELDLAQQSTTVTIGVTGNVWPAVADSVQIITKDGEYAVRELPAPSMTRRSRPAEPVAMTLDTIADTPETRAGFKEAIAAEADYTRAHLTGALAEK